MKNNPKFKVRNAKSLLRETFVLITTSKIKLTSFEFKAFFSKNELSFLKNQGVKIIFDPIEKIEG